MNDDMLKLLELSLAQPSSTAVAQGDFNKNQPKNLANDVGSTGNQGYVEAGMPGWFVDALMGGGKKGMSIIGKLLSKRKFPVGYGYPVEKAHSAIDNLIDASKLTKIAKNPPKVQISSLIPDELARLRTPPNPNLSKMILRNDPSKLRK